MNKMINFSYKIKKLIKSGLAPDKDKLNFNLVGFWKMSVALFFVLLFIIIISHGLLFWWINVVYEKQITDLNQQAGENKIFDQVVIDGLINTINQRAGEYEKFKTKDFYIPDPD